MTTERLVNQSEVLLDKEACLNYATTLVSLPVEYVLCGVDRGVGVLPKEMLNVSDRRPSGSEKVYTNPRTT
jgi:hypothetical protein